MRGLVLAAPMLVALGALAACDAPSRSTEPTALRPTDARAANDVGADAQNALLAAIRAGTARYHRVEAAIADGYIPASPCEAIPGGGIGVHYRKPALVDQTVDPSHPELLVYEPQKNGDLRLVAVALLVPAVPWDLSHAAPPALGSQPFEDKRVPDWSSPPFPTYELHVWVWQHNPNGMYATTNPTVSCAFAG